MIGSVDAECKAWARHYHWLQTRKDAGWNPRGMLGKLIEEGAGAGSSSFMQYIPVHEDPPAYTNIMLAIRKMANTHEMWGPCLVVHAHYLVWGRAKQKAPLLGISVATYWNHIDSAHSFICGCEVPRGTDELSRQDFARA